LPNTVIEKQLENSFKMKIFGFKPQLPHSQALSGTHAERSPFDPDNLATDNPRIMSNALNLKLQK